MNLQEVFCVIPVYNNAATVRNVVARARKQIPNVLVVDDGSTDLDLTLCYAETDITVLRHPRNLGKGAAILTALDFLKTKPEVRYMITLTLTDSTIRKTSPISFRSWSATTGRF